MWSVARIVGAADRRPLGEFSFGLFSRVFTAIRYSYSGFMADEVKEITGSGFNSATVSENINLHTPSQKDLSFTFAVISLSAQVARADGVVSKAEYLAFRDAFPLTGGICGKIRQLFALSCQSKIPFSQHIAEIKAIFPQQKELFMSLVERLFRIAAADKPLVTGEAILLAKIARGFELTPSEYSALHDKYSRLPTPQLVLGVKKRSPRAIIKQRYYALMQRYHPDRFAGSQISPEVQLLLTLKTAEISEAYRRLTKKVA